MFNAFLDCGPGNFVDTNDDSCNPCPLNTYSDLTGATACQQCLGGSITKTTGNKYYWDCGKILQIHSGFYCREYLRFNCLNSKILKGENCHD